MASAGNGTPQHVVGELFKMMAGVDMKLVDDFSGCVSWGSDSLPAARFVTRQEVPHGRNIWQRSFPALMCSIDSGKGLKITCTWPPSRSVVAGAPPRYGTWTMSTPAIILNSSPTTCCGVPLPADAMLILPGLALA